MTLNEKSLTATVEFLNYTLAKSDRYKREAENLTSSLKNFKELLEKDRTNFKDDSELLKRAETRTDEEIYKMVRINFLRNIPVQPKRERDK
jgi:hypothetical protein